MDAEAFLTEIVSRYSPSGHESNVSGFIVDAMNDMGFSAKLDDAGNAVGVCGKGEKTLLLAGHIDTVPGEIPVRKKEEVLFGRGTVDAKGPFAAFVMAAARHVDAEHVKLVVAGCVEEELATSKGARHIAQTVKPDVVVIGEPSGWSNITIGYKGRLLVDYQLNKSKGHSAGKDSSVADDAFSFYEDVRTYERDHISEKMFSSLQRSIRSISCKDDGFEQEVTMTLGFRIPPAFDIDGLEDFLSAKREGAELNFYGREEPFIAEKNNPLIRGLLASIREQGGTPKFKKKSGTSDMNVLGPAYGVPIATYGPGDSALDHTPDEHLPLTEYKRAIDVLDGVITKLKE